MSTNYQFTNSDGLYFTTSTIINWIDIFTKPVYKHIIVSSLDYCIKQKGLQLHAWVLMSNHLHMIISRNSKFELFEIMRDFKKFTAKQIIETIQLENESRQKWILSELSFAAKVSTRHENFRVWQDGNHAIELTDNEIMQQKLEYIHSNPVKAEWVNEPHHFKYSSATDYASAQGLLPITFLD